MPAGSFANAVSDGARTVNGPAPLSVSTKPAAETAATSVLNEPAPIAVSTIFAMKSILLCKGVALKSTGLNSQKLQEIPTPRIEL